MLTKRVVFFGVTVLTLLGALAFVQMPREEDPRIKRRNAIATVVWPGATPDRLDRLVVRPIEDELLKVSELKNIRVETRLNVSIISLELVDSVTDISLAWREVERSFERAGKKLPQGVALPVLDFSVLEVESIVLAVVGSDQILELIDAAQTLKDEILKNPDVSEVRIFGNPQTEVLIEVNQDKMHNLGISIPALLQGIRGNNDAAQTGFLINSGVRQVLAQDNDLKTPEAFAALQFETRNLNSVNLAQFAKVARVPQEPAQASFRFNGEPAIGLGVVARAGLNIESFGDAFLKSTPALEKIISPLKLGTVAFQPERTHQRIGDLFTSLISGMVLIAISLFILMGARSAVLVTLMVPVISLIGLFIYFLFGGVLHQISIAAFIISIGQFIDNIIVVTDQMQSRINQGDSGENASQAVSKQLRWPLAFATLTGICAFLPMLSAQGSTADFVFSLPFVAIITLACSYFVTLLFVPLVAALVLKPTKEKNIDKVFTLVEKLFASIALGPMWRIGALLTVIAVFSVVGLIKVQKEFFPESDRNEFIFSLELEQSADIGATQKVLLDAEKILAQDKRVKSYSAFAGGDIPRFYYNIPNIQRSPHVGQILVTTENKDQVKQIGFELEKRMSEIHPKVKFVSLFLQQGPPIAAKIELRVFAPTEARAQELKQSLTNVLEADSRVRAIRADDELGLKQTEMKTKTNTLSSLGLSGADLTGVLAFYSTGVPISEYRFGRETIPVRVRAEKSLALTSKELGDEVAVRSGDRDFLVKDFVQMTSTDGKSIIRRRNGEVFVRVLADLKPGFTFSEVGADLRATVAKMNLPQGERIEFGGDAEGAGDANTSILKVVPLAIAFLVLFLLLEFKSYRKVLIASLAVPVTIMGVFPGLWLGGAPFGFMSLLGVLALVGVSVNNIILLLEALDETGSLQGAIAARVRAIMLTTILTLMGLIPLALEESSLWPPLAWTMISGLITGTVATLIVVPALYRLFFGKGDAQLSVSEGKNFNPRTATVGALSVLLISASALPKAKAQPISFAEILKRAELASEVQIADQALKQVEAQAQVQLRQAFVPKVTAGIETIERANALRANTAFGPVESEEKRRVDAKLEITQPLFDASSMLSGRDAEKEKIYTAELKKQLEATANRLRYGELAVALLKAERESQHLLSLERNLSKRNQDVQSLVNRGRATINDQTKVEVQLQRVKNQRALILAELERLRSYLQQSLNLGANFSIAVHSPAIAKVSQIKEVHESAALAVVDSSVRALSFEAKKVDALKWPSLSLYGRSLFSEGRKLVDSNWNEYGLRLGWEIPLDGIRNKQSQQLNLGKLQAEQQREILFKDQKAMQERLVMRLKENSQWASELNKLKSKTARARKSEESKYQQGRGTLQALLDADVLDLEIQRDADVIQLTQIEDCMKLESITHQEVTGCAR